MKQRYLIAAVVAAVLIVGPGMVSGTADEGTTFDQITLSSDVLGSSVTTHTTVKAAKVTQAQYYGVCVRGASGENLDFWKKPATIEKDGTAYDSDTKKFDPGTYTYFSCLYDGGWHNVGAPKKFTVARPTTKPEPTATATRPAQSGVTKLLTIVVENHSLASMKAGMPYVYSLARQYAYSDSYNAVTHPSLPNYLAIAGGSTFDVTDDKEPSAHVLHGESIFGQAIAAGRTAGTFAESMPGNCVLSGNSDRGYAVKHNPWAYFADERSRCEAMDVPDTGFLAVAKADALPNVGMLIPNKCNDAHDVDLGCNLGTADEWLKARLSVVLTSRDFTNGALAVVVTADEDNYDANNAVLTVVLHASLDGAHKVVDSPLNHYSLSRLYSQIVGATPLREAASAPDMATAFALPVG